MLIRRAELAAIQRGEITIAFRRWSRPRVLRGTRLRTAAGVLEVTALDEIEPDDISEADALAAGLDSRGAVLAFLAARREGRIYRIGLRYVGDDPRIALRDREALAPDEAAELLARLQRMDRGGRRRGRDIGWPQAYLELIATAPGVLAATLAQGVGMETQAFKRRVRALKELGLTESLRPGYRLSPRGRAVLEALRASLSRGSRG